MGTDDHRRRPPTTATDDGHRRWPPTMATDDGHRRLSSKHLGEEEGVTTTTSPSTAAPAAADRPRERPGRTRGAGGLPYGLVLPTAFLLLLSLGYPLTPQVVLS